LEHLGVLGLGFISWKLEIRVLRENQKEMLVVEPDYLPDAEVLAFSRVYTP
jgi:hypothetical protein